MPDIRTARAERARHALLWVQRVLVWSGVVLLAGVALVMTDAYLAQVQARRALDTVRATARALPATTSVDTGAVTGADAGLTVAASPPVAADAEPVLPATGAPLGELTIPSVSLTAVVLHGDDARTLRHGPGHIPGTALPGERGTVAIAGHRDTFFRPLRYIRLGDDIFLDTPQRRFVYRVSSLRIVGPNDVSVLHGDDAGGSLTLITCYPFSIAGRAPERYVVMATAVDGPDGPVPQQTPLPASVGVH